MFKLGWAPLQDHLVHLPLVTLYFGRWQTWLPVLGFDLYMQRVYTSPRSILLTKRSKLCCKLHISVILALTGN